MIRKALLINFCIVSSFVAIIGCSQVSSENDETMKRCLAKGDPIEVENCMAAAKIVDECDKRFPNDEEANKNCFAYLGNKEIMRRMGQ